MQLSIALRRAADFDESTGTGNSRYNEVDFKINDRLDTYLYTCDVFFFIRAREIDQVRGREKERLLASVISINCSVVLSARA